METMYFKTELALDEHITGLMLDGFSYDSGTQKCDCGESFGYTISLDDEKLGYSILCESCYDNAPIQQKGE